MQCSLLCASILHEKLNYIFCVGLDKSWALVFLLTGLLQAFIFREKPPKQITNRFLTLSGATGHYGYSEYCSVLQHPLAQYEIKSALGIWCEEVVHGERALLGGSGDLNQVCVCAGHSHRDPGDISAIKHPAVCAAVTCVWRNCSEAKISARLLPVKRFSWL